MSHSSRFVSRVRGKILQGVKNPDQHGDECRRNKNERWCVGAKAEGLKMLKMSRNCR